MFALMAAVNYNYSGVVTVMLDNGADPNIQDGDGWTAMDWALGDLLQLQESCQDTAVLWRGGGDVSLVQYAPLYSIM